MNLSCRVAAGSYLSTAEDLAKFVSAHAKGGFISGESLELMLTPQKLSSGEDTNVGLGWRVNEDRAGRRFAHHGGNIVGGRAFVLLYPDHGVAVAICTNLGSAPFAEDEVLEIARPFVEHMGK
jgi:CubicO group peptidase (beta-lactamase class C family)